MQNVRHVVGSILVLAILLATWGRAFAIEQESVIPDPCLSFLAIIDRPTVSDSACVVHQGKVVLELGFQHADLRGEGGGRTNTYPQGVLRAGLPFRNEIILLAPNYTHQETRASDSQSETASGYSATIIGIKHSVGYTSSALGAVEALFTLPSGGSAFGSHELGVAFNGIAAYSLTETTGLSLQLGVSSQTDTESAGGGRFSSFISNLVATWQPTASLQFFGEIFGQSSTGHGKGAGYNADAGIQYMITPSWEVDFEGGLRLIGDLGGYTHYFGAGTGFRF